MVPCLGLTLRASRRAWPASCAARPCGGPPPLSRGWRAVPSCQHRHSCCSFELDAGLVADFPDMAGRVLAGPASSRSTSRPPWPHTCCGPRGVLHARRVVHGFSSRVNPNCLDFYDHIESVKSYRKYKIAYGPFNQTPSRRWVSGSRYRWHRLGRNCQWKRRSCLIASVCADGPRGGSLARKGRELHACSAPAERPPVGSSGKRRHFTRNHGQRPILRGSVARLRVAGRCGHPAWHGPRVAAIVPPVQVIAARGCAATKPHEFVQQGYG